MTVRIQNYSKGDFLPSADSLFKQFAPDQDRHLDINAVKRTFFEKLISVLSQQTTTKASRKYKG